MDYNPYIITTNTLVTATDHDILVAIYQYLVASVSLFFAAAILIGVSKFALWFLPKYWHKLKEKDI